MIVCSLIATQSTAWYLILLTFIPIIMVRELGYSPEQMSQSVAMIGLAGVFSGFLLPGLSDRFGRKPLTIVACLLGAIAPLGIYWGHPVL